jgi:diamine N-acetyltransferase
MGYAGDGWRCRVCYLRAVRAYIKAGFREFGRRRECKRLGQTLHDVIYMDCLAREVVSRGS